MSLESLIKQRTSLAARIRGEELRLATSERERIAAALGELERVQLGRKSFSNFFDQTSVYTAEHWQNLLCENLGQLRFQRGIRKMIHKPPQAGGSMIVSQRLTPFLLGHDPSLKIRLVTHNQTHSERFSATIRNIMQSERYRTLFPNAALDEGERSSVSSWFTKDRKNINDGQPSFMALGLKTGIVGSGGNLWIIDDPYANRDEAFSDTINEKIWNTWLEDIQQRLYPEDNVIVMFHRWQENDFAGRLESSGGWDKIRIPSICDSENDFAGRAYGDAAFIKYDEYIKRSPEEKKILDKAALTPRFPFEDLLKLRDGYINENGHEVAGSGEAVFESLHQGNPKSREGSAFKLENFHYVKGYSREEDSFFISYWDLGGSEAITSDRTANFLLHRTPGGIFTFVEHSAFRLRKSDRNNRILNVEKSHREKYGNEGMVLSFVEWQMGTAVEVTEELIRLCGEFGMRDDKVTKKLEERADPLLIQMQNGNVRFMVADWNREVEEEFLAAWHGTHDDRISTAAGAYNKANEWNFL